MVDNAFAFGQLFDEHPTDLETPAVRRFNEHIAEATWLQSIIVPLGDPGAPGLGRREVISIPERRPWSEFQCTIGGPRTVRTPKGVASCTMGSRV